MSFLKLGVLMNVTPQAIYRVIGFVASVIIGFMGIWLRSVPSGVIYGVSPSWWLPPIFVVPLLAAVLGLVGVLLIVWRPRIGGSLMITAALTLPMLSVFSVIVYLWARSLPDYGAYEGRGDFILAGLLLYWSIFLMPLALALGIVGLRILKIRERIWYALETLSALTGVVGAFTALSGWV